MAQLFANAARAELSADISSGSTTITIASGGSLFPAITGGDWFKAVLEDATGIEIVYVTAHTSGSNSFTVTRGQEGTSARAFLTGDIFGLRVTANDMAAAIGWSDEIGVTLQAYDGDLDAIAALAGTSGLLKKTAADTWTLDTTAYTTNTGTVTTASVVSANGFAGTVANASTTPAITLTTSISGILKGNGTAISAASAGTDYLAPAAIGSTVQAYNANLTTWAGKTAPSGAVVGTTDTQTLSGKTLGSTKEAVYTITDGAAFEIDPANGGIQKITLGAGRTPKGTNFASGQSVRLKVAATSYAITWTDGTLNPTWLNPSDGAGSAPTLSAARTTIIDLWKDADGLYAAHVGYA